MKTHIGILVAGSILMVFGLPVVGRSDGGEEGEGVAVLLLSGPNSILGANGSSLGAIKYDPFAPDRSDSKASGVPVRSGPLTLALEIRNGSNRAISVPTKYDGKVLRLWGRSSEDRFPLLLLARNESKTSEQVHIPPGERHTCFSLPLSEILRSNFPRKGGWEWTWVAHPAPPLSPIHRLRSNDFVSTAVFWVEVVLDNQSLRSEPVIVEVKAGQVSPDNDPPRGRTVPDQHGD